MPTRWIGNERLRAAREAWPYGVEDFDALRAERAEAEEAREFRRLTPAQQAAHIAARNRAIEEGVD